jgi:hypothetical protein
MVAVTSRGDGSLVERGGVGGSGRIGASSGTFQPCTGDFDGDDDTDIFWYARALSLLSLPLECLRFRRTSLRYGR